jgi:hypothetical protein
MKDNAIAWEADTLAPWSKVQLIDGTSQRGGLVMRTSIAGKWMYRAPTREEAFKNMSREAW